MSTPTKQTEPLARPKVPLSVGSMRNQCGACGLLFGGLTAFDRHRTGAFGAPSGRRCMTAAELEEMGLRVGAGGFWSLPAPEKVAAGRRGRAGSLRDESAGAYYLPAAIARKTRGRSLHSAGRSI